MTDTPRGPRPLGLDSDPEGLARADFSAADAELAAALRHAHAPSEIDAERHERLLSAALEEPLAPPSAAELVESERLRRALDGAGEHADLALARALAAAHAPKPALGESLERVAARFAPAQRAKVSYLRFGGLAAGLAAAAAVWLSLATRAHLEPSPDLQALTLAQSRSTAALFRTAANAGAPSTRIDRIASVRERELRENRYALWGVR